MHGGAFPRWYDLLPKTALSSEQIVLSKDFGKTSSALSRTKSNLCMFSLMEIASWIRWEMIKRVSLGEEHDKEVLRH